MLHVLRHKPSTFIRSSPKLTTIYSGGTSLRKLFFTGDNLKYFHSRYS